MAQLVSSYLSLFYLFFDLLAITDHTLHVSTEVFVVVSEDYIPSVSAFLSTYSREDLNFHIELVPVPRMMGSADGLRAVSDRIRGDFIVYSSDVLTDCSLGALVHLHQLRTADITVAVCSSVEEESDRKGGVKRMIDEEDEEYVGVDVDGRLIFKASALELEGAIVFSKAILKQCKKLSLRKDVCDAGIYVMSHWVLEFVMRSPRLSSIRTDVVPYLTKWQFQPQATLLAHIPGLEHRHRPLASLENWLSRITSRSSRHVGPELSEHMIRPSTLMPSVQSSLSVDSSTLLNQTTHQDMNHQEDLIRCYTMYVETSAPESTSQPDAYSAAMTAAICKRITNHRSYMSSNR